MRYPLSSKLEVLLRLKQAANAAFSFLSVDDPVHSYYLFLKSWGESALAAEYTRQQRLQAELVDSRQRDENERQERGDQKAAAGKGPWWLLTVTLRFRLDRRPGSRWSPHDRHRVVSPVCRAFPMFA